MKTIAVLALAAILPAQQQGNYPTWHISYPAAFKQPNGSGGAFRASHLTTVAANPGECALAYAGVPTNVGAIHCYGFRSTPTSVGGGLYDVGYAEGDYVPLLMIAPYDASYSSQVSGAVSGWDVLFCDPATTASQWIYSEPWVATSIGAWSGWVTGYPNHAELLDDLMYVLPDPNDPDLIGLKFTAQFVLTHATDGTKLSSAAKLWVQVTP